MIFKYCTPRRMLFAAGMLSACLLTESHSHGQTGSICGPTVNAIVCENQNSGAPQSEWDVSGAGDTSIQGFATEMSVTPGQTEQFKVTTSAAAFTLDIYRMGYYGGDGARKINTATIATTARNQPACLSDAATGLVDCGNWSASASWQVPAAAVSGIYFAKLTRGDTGGASHAFFIVRESDTASTHSDMLFQTSDTTWQAYNQYGGNSLYVGSPAGRAYKVSYNRPLTVRADTSGGQDSVFNAEYPMVRWLEANGYDVSYISGVDTDRNGGALLRHKAFLSVGHDEYWSGAQRTNVEAARAAGVHLAFFSGNEIFWKTRWENSIDSSGTPYRTLVCYKETHANAKIDPQDPPTWTGTWADPRFSPPADGGKPQNALTGQMFGVNDGDTTSITIPAALGKHRFWRNTTVATLAAGATATLPNGSLGYEWDMDVDNGFLPASLMRLSQTTRSVSGKLLDYGSTFGPGTVTHALTLYRASSGSLVFGAGSVQWSWGLDANHDRTVMAVDTRMKQATVNLFADMGVQPATLQAGLVGAAPSNDGTAPTSVISSPANGTSVAANTVVTISGTAADAGGGIVSGVEVSTDGGATWKPASGTTAWTFAWTAAGSGTVTIKSRAFDDSGNLEVPSPGVNVTVTSRTCPCSVWDASVVPPSPLDSGDPGSVELGMKFRADASGYVTSVRFYKASANTGTHTGSLWTTGGTQLGTVTFSGETSSGWQQANFASPIAVTANTTYVVSYHAPGGHYTGTNSFFSSAVDNAPLHALRDGTDGANGVYVYAASTAFPTNTYQSANYWVDVVYSTTPPVDTTPPTVSSVSPAANATGVAPSTAVSVTFSEAMDANSISSSSAGAEGGTFELRDPADGLINATVTYDAATRTAKLVPAAPLALSTKYTATVKGGALDPRVKDLAGNALATSSVWSFTIADSTPPPPPSYSIWPASTVPSLVDSNDPSSVELGTKFRSDVAGYITAARFYKGALNTGTHTATLWTATGTKVATATFSGETTSGWQQVAFPSPVQIVANITYVISYHAPNGHYSASDNSYFASAGVDNAPLHALQDGIDGANGLYAYSPASVFPSQSYLSKGYFVDVVFTTSVGVDTTPPTVKSVNPLAGGSGVRATASVSATFSESLDPSTVTASAITVVGPSNSAVAGTVAYDAPTYTVTFTPSQPLQYSTAYTATVAAGVKDTSGNAMTSPYAWSFITAAPPPPPPPPPTQGPGGPVLVVTSPNTFSIYMAEVLRSEGANEFATLDLSQVTAGVLANYDVVILGDMSLTAAQVSMLTTWVSGGGNLIAMRPDKQLAGLMGLTDAGSTLAEAYLLVNTASGPGAGIVNQTIQFHGTADNYTLNGATALATLYSTATTATPNPAVTSRTVGSGHAVAFTYDLARSVVYTRQGNPAWAGTERDGKAPIRSDDLFFGAKSGDVKPDYVDLTKVAIPQADEQQRFLWNIILNVNAARTPLPRFWYFPRMLPAAVIMTGDDHANNGTAGRFNDFLSASAANCSVDDWGCIRGTSYLYPNTPISDGEVASYVAQGFEIALHVNTNCADWTTTSLPGFYSSQLAQFAAAWPNAPAPLTNRTHCIVWSDWSTQAQVELNNGIRLDTTYYYWPDVWTQDRPGMFTGSGMPQRFATQTGQLIDVYQAATQMTDESGQTFPKNIDTLLNNAVGALGYYGAFTANMHTDANPSASETAAMAIVNSAKARNVPVITAKQMLDWLDARNASSFQALSWSAPVLSFTISVATGANGLMALVPATVNSSTISGIQVNGAPASYALQTIKGVQYAVFTATAGSYQVSYGADALPPTISSVSAAPAATTATVTWSTNEASNSAVSYGTSAASLTQSATNPASTLSHSVALSGLSPNTTYYMRVSSSDAAGNQATYPAIGAAPLTFTTTALSISGVVSPSQSGGGASISLSGAMSAVTSTAADGSYTFPGLASGSYTVTPSRTGYTFVPASQPVTLTNADAAAVNFSAQPVTITGTISPASIGSSATVALSGAMSAVVAADAGGNYTFTGIADGTYTVSVSRTGYTFSPTGQNVSITGGVSAAGVNFTGQPAAGGGGGSGDIVLYAAAAPVIAGAWSVVADSTAAGGARLQNPNAGAAKVTTALAAPADYFELTFTAAANTPYHLWIRGKATANRYANDSVHVQFDGTADAAGAPVYRIGTTSSAEVNIENCSGCGLSGWGWQDNGYAGVGPNLRFTSAGTQRIRVQVREDGLGIDQIVLSPVTYISASPGALKDDAIILPASDGAASGGGGGGGTTPSADVVLYAADSILVRGAWSVVPDSTAAGGARLQNPNAGAAKITTALASPVDYFELTFTADAGQPYHLWIRGKATSNRYNNDSVHVQFSDSVDGAGTPVVRIGTTGSAEVNLEDCSGCGLAAWGWQDNGYGGMGPDIVFNSSGTHTLRVQVREDGLGIDQLVLSAATYRTTAPGSLKNDTTVLAK